MKYLTNLPLVRYFFVFRKISCILTLTPLVNSILSAIIGHQYYIYMKEENLT